MNIFTFDIETIPDTANGKKILNLAEGASDAEVAEAMFAKQREKNGSDFLPLHLHRIAAISVVLKTPSAFKVWTLGNIDADEKEILQRFFNGIEKYSPTLVTWNGGGFDLPVIAPRYWETGDEDQTFRWNNYLSRYHRRHTDVMDVLAAYQSRANAPLDQIAMMLGLPGKMGMDGSKIWESYSNNDLAGIRNYCETDVLNTYLVYLRFCLIQGTISESEYQQYCQETREYLQSSEQPHLIAFEQKWSTATSA
jgi:predicted PolB exonuclease-like 3'-5' exonuclease